MSRPSSSVPNQCADDGGSSRMGKWMEAGSCGAIQGANRANATKTMTSTTPIAASGLWRAFPATRRRSEMAAADMERTPLPYLKSDLTNAVNHLEIGPVCGDQPGAVGSRGECNQHIEMQIAQFVRCEAARGTKFPQDLARLQPILFRGDEDGMIFRQRTKEFSFRCQSCAAPQLR